jgi:protein tyrosine/serine phosphatase
MIARAFPALLVAASFPLFAADANPAPGVPNFHAVNDHIYRGAQPSAEGFANLSKLGVKTVIDLRRGSEQEKSEQGAVEHAGMRYVHVPLSGYRAPSDQDMARLLAMLDDSTGWPVFVHCQRGADRTGTVIACYRIEHDHWNNEKALDEAKLHGMGWTEVGMKWYILHFHPPAMVQAALPR